MNILSRNMFSVVAMLGMAASMVSAQETVKLEPLVHTEGQLVIKTGEGEFLELSKQALESLPTSRIVTRTPWRTSPAVFDGVLLKALLSHVGLDSDGPLSVRAENDYEVVIEASIVSEVDILVATRVNGAEITRRERGPILFVIDYEEYQRHPLVSERHLVWMVAEISK